MNLIYAAILGVIQGITEWLPVSSSGHLVIFQEFFGIEQPLFFDIMLHFASILVIFAFFHKEIIKLFDFSRESMKKLMRIAVATVPIGLVGIFFKDTIENLFSSILFVGIALMITGLFLYMTKFANSRKDSIGLFDSIIIGLAQAVAILPGISRSGSTITAGVLLGNKREEAAKFSFLLAVPAILGASIVGLYSNFNSLVDMQWSFVIIGMIFSFLTGLLSINLLMKMINKGKLYYFSYYCIIVGAIIIFSKIF